MDIKKLFLFFFLIPGFCVIAQKPKSNTPPKTQVKKEVSEEIIIVDQPGFTSPIIPIPYRGMVTAPLPAQAKDNLLWYKGKKVNDSILITTDAKLVWYSKSRDIVVVNPSPKKDPSLKIIKELANTQKRKEEFYNKMAERKTSVMLYPAIVNTLSEFDEILKKFTEILKNIVKLTSSLNASAALPAKSYSTGGVASMHIRYITGVPDYIKNAYNKVMSEMKNYPSIDFPPPPSTQFSYCVNNECDSNARKKLNEEENNWNREFIKYEAGIVQQSISIFQKFEQLKLNTDPEVLQIRAGLDKAMEFAFARVDNKVDLLIRKYGKDFTRLPSVFGAAISAERQKQLSGIGKDTYATTMQKLLPLFDGFEKYLEQQMDARNYDVVFNMTFVLGTERQRQLLAASEEDKTLALMDRINSFNRFEIDMEMDYTGSWNSCLPMRDKALATNKEDIYLTMGLVNCKYQLFLAEEYLKDATNYHFGKRYNLELITRSGSTMEAIVTGEDEKCSTKQHNLTGLAIRPDGPFVTISFCKDGGQDSLRMTRMHLPGSRENRDDKRYGFWHLPDFDKYMKGNGTSPPDELLQELEETQSNKLNIEHSGKPTKEQMEKHYFEAIHREYLLKKLNELEEQNNPSVTFDANNGDEVIIDETVTKNYKEPGENEDSGEATFKIKVKVTHAPLPYKKTEIKKL